MNKPVAWIDPKELEDPELTSTCVSKNKMYPQDIPLYTHPVKELTDDEIMDYVEAFSVDMGNYYEFQPDNVLQMIRSILDEAQEK